MRNRTNESARTKPVKGDSAVAARPQDLWRADLFPFALLALYLLLVKSATYVFPPSFRSTSQMGVFAWPALGGIVLAGVVGILLSRRVGIPSLLDRRVSSTDRFLIPAAAGAVLAATATVFDGATHWASTVARAIGFHSIHIAFPQSLLIYPGGAIIVDVLYYLLPIPLLVWLISSVILRGKGREATFWTVAVLCALIEPVTQDLSGNVLPLFVNATLFAQDTALNVAQVYVFRRSGFLAPLTLRIVFYLGWHVAWGLAGR